MKGVYILRLVILLTWTVASQSQERSHPTYFLFPNDGCVAVQSFQAGRNYYYNYEGSAEHLDFTPEHTTTGFRLKCTTVLISVVSSCAARMKVSGCFLYDGMTKENDELSFDKLSAKSDKFAYSMQKYPVYFYFNSGEIKSIFINDNELRNIVNMKKAILSSLSLKYEMQGFTQPVGETFKTSRAGIFGTGDLYMTVTSKNRKGITKHIQTRRYLSKQQLPWNEHETSAFHLLGVHQDTTNDAMQLLANQAHDAITDAVGNANTTQLCNYHFQRGRRISHVTCTEKHRIPIFAKLGIRDAMDTSITQRLLSFRISTMKAKDRINPAEEKRFRNSFKNYTLAFWPKADDLANDLLVKFDPKVAFFKLMSGSSKEVAPIFSKLILWTLHQDEETINNFWISVYTSGRVENISQAFKMWSQILVDCMNPKWCESPTACTRSLSCQKVFSNQLSLALSRNTDRVQQLIMLDVFSKIKHPSAAVIQVALNIASLNPNPSTILTLGKILNGHVLSKAVIKSNDTIVDAQEFLHDIINRKCSSTSFDKDSEKSVLYAIKSLTPLLMAYRDAMGDIIACTQNPSVPTSVSVASVQAMNNDHIIELPEIRKLLFGLMADQSKSSKVRLPSFLVLIMHEPSNKEILAIMTMAYDPNEPAGIRHFIKEYIRSQLLLAGTSYSSISNQTAQNILTAFASSNINAEQPNLGGSRVVNRTFTHHTTVKLPLLKKEINCSITVNALYAGNNPIPVLIEGSFSTKVRNSYVTLLDITLDIGKVKSVLQPLFGINGMLPLVTVEHLMNIPLYRWLEALDIIPPPMPESSLRNLDKITDQFQLAKSVLDTQKKSILQVRVLREEISLNSFSQLASIRDMTMSKLLKLMEKLETGISYNETLLTLPVHFQIMAPTSLGVTLVTTVEATGFFQPAFNLIMELRKLIFTPGGSATVHFDPTIHVQVTIDRSIIIPRGCSCGSGVLVTLSHDSNIRVDISKSVNSAEIQIYPDIKNGIFSISSESLSSSWSIPAGLNVTSNITDCEKSIKYKFYGGVLYRKQCRDISEPHEESLWLDTDGVPYKITLDWGSMLATVNQRSEPAVGIKFSASHAVPAVDEPLLISSLSAMYLPTRNQMQVMHKNHSSSIWEANANLLTRLMTTESDVPYLNAVFASLNVTISGENFFRSFILVEKSSEDAVLENILSELNLQNVAKYGSTAGYDITSTIVIPKYRMKFNAVGHIPVASHDGNFTAVAKIYPGSSSLPSICTVVWEKENMIEDGDVGSKLVINFKDINANYFLYENISIINIFFNGSSSGYRKIFRYESMFHNSLRGPFFDLRQKTQFSPSGDASNYDWNATVTGSNFQLQWAADATNPTKLDVRSRLVLPFYAIGVEQVRTLSYDIVRIPIGDAPVVSYGLDVTLGTVPEGHINATLFYTVAGRKEYLHITQSRVNCISCFGADIFMTSVEGRLNFRLKTNGLQNSLYLNMEPFIAQTLSLPEILYSMNSNGRVDIGYNVDGMILHESAYLHISGHSSNYVCDALGNVFWDNNNSVLSRLYYNSTMNMNCAVRLPDPRYALDFHIGSGISYEHNRREFDSSRVFHLDSYIRRENLMVFNQTFDISVKSSQQFLKKLSIISDITYSLAKSRTNEAVAAKRGQGNCTLAYQNSSANIWTSPTHNLNIAWSSPSSRLTNGSEANSYHHNGYYFIGPFGNSTDEACSMNNECNGERTSSIQANYKQSLESFLRFWSFITEEHQRLANLPWVQLERMNFTPSLQEKLTSYISNITNMKNAATFLFTAIRKQIQKCDRNVSSCPDVTLSSTNEEALMMVQRYIQTLNLPPIQEEFDIVYVKIYIESLFEKIFEVDYALGSILQNPLVSYPYMTLCWDFVTSQRSFSPWIASSMELYKSLGFFYPNMAQYITANHHYHIFPSISLGSCDWLSLTDTDEGLYTFVLKRDSAMMAFNGHALVTHRNGTMVMINSLNHHFAVEFPVTFGNSICSKVKNNEIECSDMFTSSKFKFDQRADKTFLYADVRGFMMSYMKGLVGVSANKTYVPRYLLPDGSNGSDESEFLNRYELTGDSNCQFTAEDILPVEPSPIGSQLCTEAFGIFVSLPFVFNHAELETFIRACSEKATTTEDVCTYTDMFVHSIRRSGSPVPRHPDCLECRSDQPVELTRSNVLILISLSSDTLLLNPKILLHIIVLRVLEDLQEGDDNYVDFTLLTYGGSLQFYQPFVRTINQLTQSSDFTSIMNVITTLSFNGPSYDSTATMNALAFATSKLNEVYKGVVQTVVILAPESSAQKIGRLASSDLVEQMNAQLMNVFLVSSLNEQDCMNALVTLPQLTNGNCYRPDELSEMINAISNEVEEKINHSIKCTCQENNYTGRLITACKQI